MNCCRRIESDDETGSEVASKKHISVGKAEEGANLSFLWHPTLRNVKKIAYVRQLERRYERLQYAYFNLSAEMARLQCYFNQIERADACDRNKLIDEIRSKVFKRVDGNICPTLEQHNLEMGTIQRKKNLLIASLRQRIGSFEAASTILSDREELSEEESEGDPQSSAISETVLTSRQEPNSKIKESTSGNITKNTDKIQKETALSSPNNKSKKAKICDKLKVNLKTATEPLTSKSAKKANSDNLTNNAAVTSKTKIKEVNSTPKIQSNPASVSNLRSNKKEISTETLSSHQSIISTRSASFKELREKYQRKQSPGK